GGGGGLPQPVRGLRPHADGGDRVRQAGGRVRYSAASGVSRDGAPVFRGGRRRRSRGGDRGGAVGPRAGARSRAGAAPRGGGGALRRRAGAVSPLARRVGRLG